VLAVRPALLMIAVLSNVSLVLAAYLRKDGLLTVHISGTLALDCRWQLLCLIPPIASVLAIVDIWSLVLLLPHALFLVRFLFDALLMGVALEARSHLVTWQHLIPLLSVEADLTRNDALSLLAFPRSTRGF